MAKQLMNNANSVKKTGRSIRRKHVNKKEKQKGHGKNKIAIVKNRNNQSKRKFKKDKKKLAKRFKQVHNNTGNLVDQNLAKVVDVEHGSKDKKKKLKNNDQHKINTEHNTHVKHQKNKNNTDTQSMLNKKLKAQKIRENSNSTTIASHPNLDVKKLKELLSIRQKENKKQKDSKPQSLRERMMTKLKASRFRYLNETLYNNQSSESKSYFKNDPDSFKAYHEGYKQQVEQWPLNPLDVIITSIKQMPNEHIIADFGCGEGKLASSVPHKVHSFDLVSLNENIVACDIAHTPLLTSGVHVVVFCLSLMGTNLSDYIIEANRVLKKDGILKIAEVESRFERIGDFIKVLESYGFKNVWTDLSHNLFYFLDFKKERDIGGNRNKLPPITLKPCLYKKR